MVAGAGVNPADQRWGWWPLLPLRNACLQWFLGGDPSNVPGFLFNWA